MAIEYVGRARPLRVPCKICGARVGEWCATATPYVGGSVHVTRVVDEQLTPLAGSATHTPRALVRP